MPCPHCGAPLSPRAVAGLRALGCAACRGLWLPAAQLEAALRTLSADPALRAEAVAFERRSTQRPAASAAACPVCHAQMSLLNYGYDSNVLLENCAACRAYWVGEAQLGALASFVKGEEKFAPDPAFLAKIDASEKARERRERLESDLGWAAVLWCGLSLPTGTSIPVLRRCWLVWSLIAMNAFVYVLQWHVAARPTVFTSVFGLVPNAVRAGQSWRLLTNMFVHAGLLHVGFNMYYLWLFGRNIEDDLGRPAFIGIYLVSGLMAGLFFMAAPRNAAASLIGASGAISGLLGAFYARYPGARVHVRALRLGTLQADLPAHFFLGLYFLQNLVSAATGSTAGGIAFVAHVGGFVAGYLAVSPKPAGSGVSSVV